MKEGQLENLLNSKNSGFRISHFYGVTLSVLK